MDKRIETILEYAIMAPSGDNCQPWLFKVDGLTVDLFNDPDKDKSLYNIKQRASLIAHGALLETIRTAAPSIGLYANQQLFPQTANPNHIARLTFKPGPVELSARFKAIPERHTNRERYQPVNISDNQVLGWLNLPEDNGEKIWASTQTKQIDHLAEQLCLNDRLVFEVADLHGFLFKQVRWNNIEARETGDGLDIKTLGLNTMDQLSFPWLKNYGLISILNKLGFSRIVQLKSRQLLKTASAIAIVTMPDCTSTDYVQGGMLWQRLLLQLTSEGLTAQPVAGLACLMQSNREGLLECQLTVKQRHLLQQRRKALLKIAGCDESSTLLTTFRIGRGPKVVRALRRPLESFLLR